MFTLLLRDVDGGLHYTHKYVSRQCTLLLVKAFYLKSNPQAQRRDLLENFLLWALESDPKTLFLATERISYYKKQND